MDRITLSEALGSDRLAEFIDQAEAEGVGSVSADEFETRLGWLIKAPRPEDRTSRSPGRDGLRGK